MKRKPLIKQLPVLGGFIIVFGVLLYTGYRYFLMPAGPQSLRYPAGLNTQLPQPETTRVLNKLEQYLQSEQDSLKRAEERKQDPYVQGAAALVVPGTKTITVSDNRKTDVAVFRKRGAIYPEQDIISKAYAAYDRITGNQGLASLTQKRTDTFFRPLRESLPAPEQSSVITSDSELLQLSGMLDKISAIQQYGIHTNNGDNNSAKPVGEPMIVSPAVEGEPLLAVVHGVQELVSGATLRIRLLHAIRVGETVIPKGSFLYGTCTLGNERLLVQIRSISCQSKIFRVSLSVYDLDGIEGIYVPGAVAREVAKENAERTLQSFHLDQVSTSFAAQAAGAGLDAAKSLFSAKLRTVRVTVKAGHQVVLQNNALF